jgi:hypothetical protein
MNRLVFALLVLAGCGGSPKSATGPATAPSGLPPPPGKVETAIYDNEFHVSVDDRVLVQIPALLDDFDDVSGEAMEVEGSDGRLFLAQLFSERGEDEFSREIHAWLIDASRREILWTGKATYQSSFGACEIWTDIPEPSFQDGTAIIELASGVEILEEGTDRCEGPPLSRRAEARITLK